MNHLVPVFAPESSALEKLQGGFRPDLEYVYYELSRFEELLCQCGEESGMAIVYLTPDHTGFLDNSAKLHKQLKKNKLLTAIVMDGIDQDKKKKIIKDLDPYEFFVCLDESSPISMQQEVNDLKQIRNYMTTLHKKTDEFKTMAYQAMESASEIGAITLLLEKNNKIKTKEQMMDALFETMKTLNVSGSLLYSSEISLEEYYFSDDQEYKEKERKAMCTFRDFIQQNQEHGRFTVFADRLIVAGKYITLMIRRLPENDEERGRIRDTFGAFINAADVLAGSVETEAARIKREAIVAVAVQSIAQTITDVRTMFKSYEKKTMSTMDELFKNTEEGLAVLGLTEEQENYFLNHLEMAMEHLVTMYSSGIAIERSFESIVAHIDGLQHIS